MSNPTSPIILFVEDDKLKRVALASYLQQAGFRISEAGTGRDALRLVTEGTEPPDLVLIDSDRADKDGFEIRRYLRADPATAAIPVLHLSDIPSAAPDRTLAPQGSAESGLTRPVAPEEMVALVQALLRTHWAEEAARAATRAWQATFDTLHDALLILDTRQVVSHCNRAAAALLGRSESEVAGCLCRDLFRQEFGPEGESVLDAIQGAGAGTADQEVRLGGRWLRVSSTAVDRLGVSGRVLFLTDVTARRALEERLRHAEKLEAIGRLVGGAAHEFNNLLTGVIGNLAVATRKADEANPCRASIQAAEAAAWRAATVTQQLLGFARRTEFRPGSIDLRACVMEAAVLLRPALEAKVQLEIVCPEELSQVWADPGGMMQVLLNLCLNARDAMPEGGTVFIELAEATSEEVTAAGHEGGFVRLRVRDTGDGIAMDAMPHLFEPFFTTKEVGKGTGLGLSVVHGVTEKNGGWVTCHSAKGQGTCFDVFMPRMSNT